MKTCVAFLFSEECRPGGKMENNNKAYKLSILVVDDEANIRKTLSYCLAAEDHTVIAVSNSADAIDEARRRSFDLAFVDLKLGRGRWTGFDSIIKDGFTLDKNSGHYGLCLH